MTETQTHDLAGSCMCGAIRYEHSGPIEASFGCHCHTCQRQASAPWMLYFIAYEKDGFRITKGTAKGYASSDKAKRYFCADCGTPVYFQYNDLPGRYVVNQGTLDPPNSIPPMGHIQTASSPYWYVIGGDAPQFEHDFVADA